MTQERVQKQKAQSKTDEEVVEQERVDATNAELSEKTDEVLGDIDGVLDEQDDAELLADMDEVLGTEAEARQMVSEYIQKGGQ